MDRYDPLEWTASFVIAESEFCKEQLIKGSTLCIQCLKKKDYYIAGYALSGILNGLDLLQSNTDMDLCYCITHFALAAGIVYMLDGSQETERAEKLREMAIASLEVVLENGRDFLTSDYIRAIIGMISELRSDMSMTAILNKEIGEDATSVLIDKLEYLTTELQKEVIRVR